MMLPTDAPYSKDVDVKELAKYSLTGGQINLIVKNTAYKIAVQEEPLFSQKDFIDEINREKDANFDSEKSMGFLSRWTQCYNWLKFIQKKIELFAIILRKNLQGLECSSILC